ncbi:MAG: tRNA pseudouridine(55) synthase TruB [Bacteroidales bacterium]|nr:tRNA pseudouridine(55) synthase TruB [Bacteroidales bacterium]MCF6341474.1 tRNA pseudouridine(55) synthase TruB [Bacteroidales bacterium]
MRPSKAHIFNFAEGEVLLIDKPLEWTSFDVVNHLRAFIKRTYNLKKLKVGHAGTLDPLATGLLILCTGKMTKRINEFQGMDKVYIGQMTLGASTPSFDKETEPDRFFPVDHLCVDELAQAGLRFCGEIEQTPPVYSAVKIEGKRAFEYARKAQDVELKARKVTIHQFELLNFTPPHLDFSVKCSKGTYIRSLVSDFGKSLNNGAYLSGLRRTKIGEISVNDAVTIEEFKKNVLLQPETS